MKRGTCTLLSTVARALSWPGSVVEQLHGTESLRSCSPHVMEPECSLPCLQDPDIFTYPEPDESSPRPPSLFFFKIDFRIILPCNVCLNLPSHFSTSGFSHQNSVRIYCLPHTCHMPLASLILDLITPVLRSTNHYASNYVFFSITHRSKYSIVDES